MSTPDLDTSVPIVIEAEAPQTLAIDLVGVRYNIVPPKAALAMRMARNAEKARTNPELAVAELDSWIGHAFGKKGAKDIQKRLEDPADALDIIHIAKLMEALAERLSGNPTT